MFEKLEEIYNSIQNQVDLHEIGRKLSEFFINEFDAGACEITFLEEDGIFSIIHFALKKNDKILHDQDEIDCLFGVRKAPIDGSLIGYCVKNKEKYLWVGKDENFKEWVHKKKKVPVLTDSALRYPDNMPSKVINNFIVLPIIIPKDRRMVEMYSASACFHIFNLCNGSIDEAEIKECTQKIDKIFNYISIIMSNAIFYNRAKEELEVSSEIESITTKCENMDDVLEKTVSIFAKKLKTPLSTIWFPDPDLDLLVLHSFHIKPEYSKVPINKQNLIEIIETKAPKILKAENCLIGKLLHDKDLPWIKKWNLTELPSDQYSWDSIRTEIKTNQFVALPIRGKDSLISIIVLHPTLIERDFEKVQLSFFGSYTSYISKTLKYFIAKSFSDKVNQLSAKLMPLVKKREEIFYNELVYKIMEVIDAEACSIFEAKGGDSYEKGIYLKATTDKRDYARKRIGTKIYDIDSKSITGHIALTGEPIIAYEIENVHEIIPEIKSMSKRFMEKTVSPLHTSYIGVPIPSGEQNFNDKNASALILRCINKKTKRTLTGFFSVDDKHLLKYVGVVLEYFRKVLEVLYERNDLIDLIIHEIENPIVSIRGKIDIINNAIEKKLNFDKTRIIKKLKDIEEMASLLRGWASNMEILNRLMQEKAVPPSREWISLWPGIIKHVIYWMAPVLKINGILPSDIELYGIQRRLTVHVDKDHLRQVFYNLLSNAIKYAKPGGMPRIAIELEERKFEVGIKVIDWGVGIFPEQKEQIFKMGFRGSYAEKNNIKGKGFGLWLCKKLLVINGLDVRITQCKNPTIVEVAIPSKYLEY